MERKYLQTGHFQLKFLFSNKKGHRNKNEINGCVQKIFKK